MQCAECGTLLESRSDGWDLPDGGILCKPCFRKTAQKAMSQSRDVVSGSRKKLLRKWAKEEYAEVVPFDLIKELFEQGLRKAITPGGDMEVEISTASRKIQFMTAIQIEQAKLDVIDGFEREMVKAFESLRQECRENMRKLRGLGAQ